MPAVFLCKFNVLYDIMSSKKSLSLRKNNEKYGQPMFEEG